MRIREILIEHFFRRSCRLNQQKFKTIERFAHFCQVNIAPLVYSLICSIIPKDPDLIKYTKSFILDRLKNLDDEIASCQERYQRLKNDHYFIETIKEDDLKQLPQKEDFEYADAIQSCASNISKDDIISYARDFLFQHNASRPIRKIFTSLKWIHYTNRFEILRSANDSMYKVMKGDETSLRGLLDFHKAFISQEFKQMDKEDSGSKFFLNELFLLMEPPAVLPLTSRYDIPPLILGTKPEIEYN